VLYLLLIKKKEEEETKREKQSRNFFSQGRPALLAMQH
jgi:hypothetical protein